MAFKLGQTVATLESLSEDGALGATEDALESAQTATDVADGNTDQVVEAGEIDQLDLGVEDAFAAVDRVEELKEVAEDTMKDGGMDEATAKIVEVAHESIMASIGMSHRNTDRSDSPVLSFESYGSSTSRAAATQVTMEKLSESAAKIFDNIKKALIHAWNLVKNFFAGLLKNRALMEKHLNSLEQKVKEIKDGDQMKDGTVKGGASAIRIAGAANPETAKKVLASASALLAGASAMATKMTAAAPTEDWVKQFNGTVDALVNGLPKNGEGHGYIAGGRAIVIEGSDEEGKRLKFVDASGAVESAKAPSKTQLLALIGDAKAVLKSLRDYEKVSAALDKAQSTVGTMLDKAKGAYARAAENTEMADAVATRKAARTVVSAMNKIGGPIPGAAFAAVKGAADYITAGLNNHGAPKEKKKG